MVSASFFSLTSKNSQPFFETPRLLIQVPSLRDLDQQYELQSNFEVMKHIGNGVRSKEEVLESLKKAIHHYEKFKFSLGSVFEKSTKQFMGRAGLIHLGFNETLSTIEVAFALLPKYWNKGYATELASMLVQWGFKNLSCSEIVGVTSKDNFSSIKVLKKIGMSYVKEIQYHDHRAVLFSVIKLNGESCRRG